jgi:parallel beta-helix repeat protein
MKKNYHYTIIFFILILFAFPSLAAIPGDFNSDSHVNFSDLLIFAVAYNTTSSDAKYNPLCDLNSDDAINFSDLLIFAVNYGKEEPPVNNITQGTYYATIQAAIDVSTSGDEIVVSPGTYNENIDFLGKNITLRSNNPDNQGVVESTIIDGGNNGSVLIFTNGEGSDAVLNGFTITNGSGTEDESGSINGGGIYILNSSPTITGNIITNNTTDSYGGGIYAKDSSSIISSNTISKNTSVRSGGGFYVSNSLLEIESNIIRDNSSDKYGGGIYMYNCGLAKNIKDNIINGNKSIWNGAGIYIYNSSPDITGNTIAENITTNKGGGIAVAYNCSSYITKNNITKNKAESGGGICVLSGSPTIGGIDLDDTGNFNTICSNSPDQVDPNSYPHNYIYDNCL